MRPENERALREGFQRKVAEHRARYAEQVAHAERLAAALGLGDVVAVLSAEVRSETPARQYVASLLPMAAIPVAIAGAVAGVPGAVPLLLLLPFVTGGWFVASLMRGREKTRRVWFYACSGGFTIFEGPHADAVPVRWSDITAVRDVWTDVIHVEGQSSRALTAYELHLVGGRQCVISRDYENVLDPYRDVGPLLSTLSPGTLGRTLPKFVNIDDIIARYARHPDQRA